MLLATFAVAVLPVLVVSAIQLTGILRSTLSSVVLAAALSLVASVAGSALWTRRRGSRDVVFADLMIWGWVRRLRTERRLGDARELLGNRAKLSPSRQAELLERLSAALEARDSYTHGHSRRVTRYSEAIARGMGLTRAQVAKVRTAAAVHDVGKIKTPRDILNKPGRLTDEEFAAIKLHPVDGAELVAGMGDRELTAMVRHHHERLDGRGYPDGLGVAEIPLGARIIAVADTFDAITSTRPYRAGSKHKFGLDILRKESGSQLDPEAVAAFLSYYTGRRSVAWWSVLVTEPPRFVWWLLGWFQGAGAAPIAKGVVAAAATALVGATLSTPPTPEMSMGSKGASADVAQRPVDRAGSGATPPPRSTPWQSEESSSPSGHRLRPAPRGRSHRSPDGAPKRSGRNGSRPVPVADDPGTEPGPDGGSGGGGSGGGGSAGGGSGGGGSGGGGSAGGSGGGGSSGGGSSGGGSETGSDPGPLPTVDAPELPPLPADVSLPETQTPELPPLPEADSLPQVEPPPKVVPEVLPSLDGG
jgi:putative nucleotidyltransferase with HDIG domain